jgi:hypothetical protein
VPRAEALGKLNALLALVMGLGLAVPRLAIDEIRDASGVLVLTQRDTLPVTECQGLG